MTLEELKQVRFHFVAHLSLEKEHLLTYASEDGRLGFCDHTNVKKNGYCGKSYRYYRIDRKIYTTKEEFEDAIKDFNPNTKLL